MNISVVIPVYREAGIAALLDDVSGHPGMAGYRARNAAACSADTLGFLKKLPAFPNCSGCGNLSSRNWQIESKICCAVTWSPNSRNGP